MAKEKNYTITFMYDVNDHSLRFPLKADVQPAGSGEFMITNIRQEHQEEGSLLPPIRVRKDDGIWICVDTDNASLLSAAIGGAIDARA